MEITRIECTFRIYGQMIHALLYQELPLWLAVSDGIRKYRVKYSQYSSQIITTSRCRMLKKSRLYLDLIKSERKFLIVTEKDAARLVDNKLVPEEWKDNLFLSSHQD